MWRVVFLDVREGAVSTKLEFDVEAPTESQAARVGYDALFAVYPKASKATHQIYSIVCRS